MSLTTVVTEQQIDTLATKLQGLDLDQDDTIALLTIFELAGEALAARLDDAADVGGFAMQAGSIGIQVSVPGTVPSPGDGLVTSIKGRKAGKGQQEYLVVKLENCMISSY